MPIFTTYCETDSSDDSLLHLTNWHGARFCSFDSTGDASAMLRITTQSTDHSAILLKLEGKLLEQWVEELERSINGSLGRPNSLRLDLSALTFADAVGLQALTKLIRGGATLTACSGFIAALLHVEKP
jgi:ABC-type transporter Mla MlaB component